MRNWRRNEACRGRYDTVELSSPNAVDFVARKSLWRVYIPNGVASEIRDPEAPAEVRRWANDLPDWITVVTTSKKVNDDLLHIDLGEREAIVLVGELNAELLLVDDMPARLAAQRLGIEIAGTLSILRDSANAGLIHFEEKLSELLPLGFRATPVVLDQIRAGLI